MIAVAAREDVVRDVEVKDEGLARPGTEASAREHDRDLSACVPGQLVTTQYLAADFLDAGRSVHGRRAVRSIRKEDWPYPPEPGYEDA